VFFKVWITVTLVVYVAAFVAMMIAMMFARSSDDRDDRGGGGGDGLFWLWFWLMPDLAPRGYYERRPERKRPTKRFYLSVFDFVFGPKEAPLDPRQSDKRLLAFLRDHKGRVSTAELVALTGLSYDEADQEMTRLMAEYDGEVEVTDDGTLVYVFEGLLPSADETGEWWAWTWDRKQTLPTLTGNTQGTNLAVGALAGFSLIGSLTIGPAFLLRMHLAGSALANFFISWFPLAFTSTFFAVPALRLLKHRRRQRRLARQSVRSELLREIWMHPDARHDPAQLAALVAERTGQPKQLAAKAVEALLVELDGEVETGVEGGLRYTFPRLAQERKAIDAARERVRVLPTLGTVVFSSEDEQPKQS
jgi:hypothetical protein